MKKSTVFVNQRQCSEKYQVYDFGIFMVLSCAGRRTGDLLAGFSAFLIMVGMCARTVISCEAFGVRRERMAEFGVHRDAVTRQIGQSAPDRRRSGVGQYADLDTVFLQQRLHPLVARAERICEKQHVFLAGILRDEVDALLEVLADALVIRRLRLALQPLDAVDAVRCGRTAVFGLCRL